MARAAVLGRLTWQVATVVSTRRESLGYHEYGDPWREQRYWGD